MASVNYEIARNNTSAVAVWLLHIHFPDFFDIPEKDFYFSTTDYFEFFIDGENRKIKGKLSAVPRGRHQKDRGNDYAEFSLSNSNNSTYQDFLDYEDLIEKAEIKIFECFEITQNYFEGEQRFFGYLRDFTLNESDKTLDFTAFSDLSRPGFTVGARILTRERCGTEFNYNGLNSPEYHLCGWQTIQGGNPVYCSKLLKGVDGCIAHGNAHRFYAVPALSIAQIDFVPSSQVDFPYETNPCFTDECYVVLPDWSIAPINVVQSGIIKGFDMFTGAIINTEIERFDFHYVDSYVNAHFEKGGIIGTTEKHLFNISDSSFLPVKALEGRTVQGVNQEYKYDVDLHIKNETVNKKRLVYNYKTACDTFLITNKSGMFKYKTHNTKQYTPIEY